MFKDKPCFSCSGWMMVLASLAGVAICVGMIFGIRPDSSAASLKVGALFGLAFFLSCFLGLFTVNPNEAVVLTFFGNYVGTIKENGLRWTIPFFLRRSISQRVRNFESAKLKVNDSHGNPIEIGAVVVWSVSDAAQALFEVEKYENFVKIQTEAAIRNLAMRYPYDAHDGSGLSLLGSPDQVTNQLRSEIQERLAKAGVHVNEARISHLAYAAEIAMSMLQRQQASAVIAARQKIVEGAVGMVEMALRMLAQNKIVELDEEKKAQMVSNLLVVLCGERSTTPIINTGTIY